MDPAIQKKYEARAEIMKALSHPTRLFIIDRLAKNEECVCELTNLIGSDQSTVSKHISILKHAGIIGDQKRGTSVFYRLKMPCVLNYFSCIDQVMRMRIEENEAVLV